MITLCDDRCPSHSGILAGVCHGRTWLYPQKNPTFAVTYSSCVGGCGVFGKIENKEEIGKFLNKVFADLERMDIHEFEFSCEKEELTKQILEMYANKKIYSEVEFSYRYHGDSTCMETQNKLTEIDITPVNKEFLANVSQYGNSEMLQERLHSSWKNEDEFLQQSLAYVAIANRKIAGIIFGSGKYKEYVAIDIEVDQEYQKQGIAKELTRLFVNECNRRGYIPQWDCVESNVASQKTAESMGFELLKKRPYYWFAF